MTSEYLFVYGTLRKGAASEMQRWFARYADFAGSATYQGRLYKIDDYPGAVPSKNSTHRVKGEVYSLREATKVLSKLDEYEGCGPGFSQPTEYVRERQAVVLSGGRELIAWVYIYNRATAGLAEIASGDFLRGGAPR